MKMFLRVLFLIAIPFTIFSQKNDIRLAPDINPAFELDAFTLPTLNNKHLLDAELARRGPGIAPKFAETFDVEINPTTDGVWEKSSNGNAVWRFRINSEGAESLNLGFSKYNMPQGGSLILYSSDYQTILGPFTPADNEEHEELWTPVVDGDDLIIEVQVPEEQKSNLQLQLKSINHDFIGFSNMSVLSGSCNLDVICNAADGWGIVDGYRDIIQSVAVISTGGGTFCTGFLVNNVNNDCTPFFMTANHCGINNGNAASLVTYWNFENSTCREPGSSQSGGNGDGQLNDFNTGAIFRCAYAPSDMTLVELDDPVSPTANAFFAGWSAEFEMPQDTIIGIHHPSTDEKRISFEFDPAQPGNGLNNTVVDITNADHVIIPDWDIGTTEPGSSGSPVFNNQHQVVGQLHGGGAACGNDLYDSYGWFYTSWEGGGTAATGLRFWLDPNDTGILNIPGKNCSFNISTDPGAQEVCTPVEASFNLTASDNFASDVTLSASGLPAGAMATFSPNPVAPGGTSAMTITTTGVATGAYNIQVDGTDGVESTNSQIFLTVLDGAPAAASLQSPPDAQIDASTIPQYTWDATSGSSYEIQVATDAAFTDVIDMATGVSNANYNGVELQILTTYFWRVRAMNLCGEGGWSPTWSFTTAEIACGPSNSADVPVTIDGGPPNTVTSTLVIATEGEIVDLNVENLDISHTYIGDLSANLESPSGTVVQLFAASGCSQDNILVGFDDNAVNTDADFAVSCEGGGTAVAGNYQSIDLLSLFNGESAAGTWTLTVVDGAGQDGGAINAWSLGICSIIVPDVSIAASADEIEVCVDENGSFEITVGDGFEGPVTLSASGNPAGTTVAFATNPVMPGASTNVDVTGVAAIGTYEIMFVGDDGTSSNTGSVSYIVQDTPDMAALSLPANGSNDIAITPAINWETATYADDYLLEVASDIDFINVVATTTTANTNFNVTSDLDYGTTYYWRITAQGNCGNTVSEIFSFTTLLDLSVNVTPNQNTICNTETIEYEISVGNSFENPSNISYTIDPVVTIDVNFDVATDEIMPGSTVTGTVSNLSAVPAGTYTLTFYIEDGINDVGTPSTLVIESAPPASSLSTPANMAIEVDPLPALQWTVATDADNYTLEIATDANFTDIVVSQNIATSGYTLTTPLDPSTTYYWRVTSINECGNTVSDVFSFTTIITDAVFELAGTSYEILPNPTKGQVDIRFSNPLNQTLMLEVYSVNGQLLQQMSMAPLDHQATINLSQYASGIYLLKVISNNQALTNRIILQK